MIHTLPQRGFTLLIAVVLASVSLSIGMALLDIALKQVILSSSARQSQIAFYNADSVLECALYYDQHDQLDTFGYAKTSSPNISCNGVSNIPVSFTSGSGTRERRFTVPCATGGTAGEVIITKDSDATTGIYATGFNTCNVANERRIERGLKVTY